MASQGRSPGATDVTNNQSSGATDNHPPSALTFDQFTPQLLEQLLEYMQRAFSLLRAIPPQGSRQEQISSAISQLLAT